MKRSEMSPEMLREKVAKLEKKTRRLEREQKTHHETQRLFEDIVGTSSNITIVATDLDHNITYWNHGAENLLGYSAQEMIGRRKINTIYDRRHRDAITRLNEARRRMLASGQSVTCDIAEVKKGGGTVWLKLTITPRRDDKGEVVGMLGVGQDITRQKETEQRSTRTMQTLRRAMNATIHAMALTVEKRDPYTAGHMHRVADLGRAIACEMGLNRDTIDCIRMGGIIHDLGKVYVPAEILNRPGGLSNNELTLIRTHSQAGFDIVKYIDFPWPVADVILQHHERMDGTGYPAGISGAQVRIEARIIAVADVVESMSSHRPYRPALGQRKALAEIEANRGTLYDADVVDSCLRLFRDKGYEFKMVDQWKGMAPASGAL